MALLTLIHNDQMHMMKKNKSAAILMCTYNGENFIEEQLESIKNQTFKNLSLFISDDGSSDRTLEIVKSFKQKNMHCFQEIKIIEGPSCGFAKNFLNLVKGVGNDYDFYSFADQDDFWHEDKIESGIFELEKYKKEIPSLFCSRTKLVNQFGKKIGYSKNFKSAPKFQNALVQSIAGGNTMIFNKSSKIILNEVNVSIDITSHDWLLYILISACDGNIVFSQKPKIDYRIHKANLIGSNLGFKNFLKRSLLVFQNKWINWNNLNIEHLKKFKMITPSNKKILDNFISLRHEKNIFMRILLFKKSGLRRQTVLGNISLFAAIVFKKI